MGSKARSDFCEVPERLLLLGAEDDRTGRVGTADSRKNSHPKCSVARPHSSLFDRLLASNCLVIVGVVVAPSPWLPAPLDGSSIPPQLLRAFSVGHPPRQPSGDEGSLQLPSPASLLQQVAA